MAFSVNFNSAIVPALLSARRAHEKGRVAGMLTSQFSSRSFYAGTPLCTADNFDSLSFSLSFSIFLSRVILFSTLLTLRWLSPPLSLFFFSLQRSLMNAFSAGIWVNSIEGSCSSWSDRCLLGRVGKGNGHWNSFEVSLISLCQVKLSGFIECLLGGWLIRHCFGRELSFGSIVYPQFRFGWN